MPSPNEKVAIVDRQNNVIGYKLARDLTDDDCWRIIALWIENSKGGVLLQKRSMQKKLNPGRWTCAVEGTVTGNDSYDETAVRESEEEIGLVGVPLEPANLYWHKSVFGYRWCQGYRATVDWPLERFKIQSEEVAELAWVDKQTVIREIMAGSEKYPKAAPKYFKIFNLG